MISLLRFPASRVSVSSAYKQRGSLAAVIRMITFTLPSPREMGIPDNIIGLSALNKGLVLVTGPAGSGKSTTLSCIIDHINHTQEKHIITWKIRWNICTAMTRASSASGRSTQIRESYVTALRAALRQSPDVILLGEMRDFETMQVAMTAAETGHLVFSTLHTIGTASTIDRIIDVFPANQQRQITVQLSMVLQAVICQQLVPSVRGNLIPAFEIMTMNPAIRNMIRDGKVPQIDGILYSSANNENLVAMDTSLAALCRSGQITEETALAYASNPEMMKRKL